MPRNNNNKEMKLLQKLFDNGYYTEKDVTSISLEKMLTIPNITVGELSLLNELQKAIKSNKIISFLGDIEDDKKL